MQLTEAFLEYYARIYLAAGTQTTLTSDRKYHFFNHKLGEVGAGFSNALTRVQTNWEGEVKAEGFAIEGIALGVVHPTLKSVENASDAYFLATKCNVVLKFEGNREVNLGRFYNWPQVHGPAINHIPGGTPGGVDHSMGSNGIGLPTRMLAESIPLAVGKTFRVILEIDPNDIPATVANQYVDIRVIGKGRLPID